MKRWQPISGLALMGFAGIFLGPTKKLQRCLICGQTIHTPGGILPALPATIDLDILGAK